MKRDDTYAFWANRLFGGVADQDLGFFRGLKDELIVSDLGYLYRTYVSQMILTPLVVFVIFSTAFLAVSIILEFSFRRMIFFVVGLPALVGVLTFFFLRYYPRNVIQKRGRKIEVVLPFALNHMSAVISSGIPPSSVFSLLTHFEEYGEVSRESQKIARRIHVLGEDVITALREVAKTTPSESFKEILFGIVSTLETGGDLKAYLSEKSKEALFEYRLDRKRKNERLGLYATIYMSVLVAAPLFIIAVLSILNFLGGTLLGLDILQLLRISIYGLIPILNIFFIGLIYFFQEDA